jgi:uncharacterized membrane protein (UPF0136 family)
MIFNGLVLILLGLYGYLIAAPDKKSPTAFIGPVIGIILILLSFPSDKGKVLALKIAFFLTLAVVVVFFYVGFRRENPVIIISAVVSLVCFIFYLSDFVFRKKEPGK